MQDTEKAAMPEKDIRGLISGKQKGAGAETPAGEEKERKNAERAKEKEEAPAKGSSKEDTGSPGEEDEKEHAERAGKEDADAKGSAAGEGEEGPARDAPGGNTPTAESGESAGKSRAGKQKKHRRRLWAILLIIIAAIAAAAAIMAVNTYRNGVSFYEEHFFPDTTVAGVEVGDMTAGEAEEAVTSLVSGYVLTITDKAGEYRTTMAEAGVEFSYGDGMEALLRGQDAEHWISQQNAGHDYGIDIAADIDEEALTKLLYSLPCRSQEITEPADAYVYYDSESLSYVMVDEVEGNEPDDSAMLPAIKEALLTGEDALDLSGDEYYRHPSVRADDPELSSFYQTLSTYMSASVTYADGSVTYEIPKSQIHAWIVTDGTGAWLDRDAIYSYITDYICPAFNTIGSTRTLTTPLSGTFTVSGGTYGYDVWRTPETEQLMSDIESGSAVTRAPVYYISGYGRGADNDIGGTYIDVNLGMQRAALVQNGAVTVESDIVTANTGAGYVTPTGVYQIEYKTTNYTMVKYDAFVYYWMPIDLDTEVGLHDATWRDEFGGDIYKTNGSHGCINMPYEAAKAIYERAETGTPVIVHW